MFQNYSQTVFSNTLKLFVSWSLLSRNILKNNFRSIEIPSAYEWFIAGKFESKWKYYKTSCNKYMNLKLWQNVSAIISYFNTENFSYFVHLLLWDIEYEFIKNYDIFFITYWSHRRRGEDFLKINQVQTYYSYQSLVKVSGRSFM